MRKELLGIGLASLMLAACTSDQQPTYTAPLLPAYNGPVVEIPGIEPKYEAPTANANNNYKVNGVNYKIVTDTSKFSQIGLASTYSNESLGNKTASGEPFDSGAFTAAHPNLPIPSYVRVTNLANNRQIVVRINDRGPFIPGRIIDLSPAAADRLNISNNSRVRLDIINVSPEGQLSGPGTIGTRVARQSYALPARPALTDGMSSEQPELNSNEETDTPAAAVREVPNASLQSQDTTSAPVHTNGLQGAPQPLASGVLASDDDHAAPENTPTVAARNPPTQTKPAAAPAANTAHGSGHGYVVQVVALNNAERANQLKAKLSEKYQVAGNVEVVNNKVYRVQLGGYPQRSQALALQQRLAADNLMTFVTTNN